jgi:hypothetical protein
MADMSTELHQLLEELRAVDAEFNAELERISGVWNFALGPFTIRRPASAKFVTQIYGVFNAACFIAGITLASIGGVFAAIGVAMIVGALFSVGAFVAQFWTVQAQDEINIQRKISGDGYQAKLKALEAKRLALFRRIEKLSQTDSSENRGLQ